MAKFLRRNWNRQFRLGKRRKKKRIWRRPTGRDNKMREKRKGYPSSVGIGNKRQTSSRGKLEDKKVMMIRNLKDLEKIGKGSIGVVSNIGKRKKIELAKKAKEMKIELWNINVKKFLKKNIGNKLLEDEKIKVENKK